MGAVLGLDLATRLCGYCVGDGLGEPEAGAWELPDVGDDLGRMLCAYEDYLLGIFSRHDIAHVCYESPILVRFDKLLKVRKLYSLGGETERFCVRRGTVVREADLRRVKRELAGHAGADKADMVAAATKMRIGLPATKAAGREDAADAVGCWLIGLRDHDRTIAARWDTRLYSARGAML